MPFGDYSTNKKKKKAGYFSQFADNNKTYAEIPSIDTSVPSQPSGIDGLINSLQPKQATPAANEPTGNWFVDIQKNIYNSTLKPVEDFFTRTATQAVNQGTFGVFDKVADAAPQQNYYPDFIEKGLKPAETTSEKAADLTGMLIGLAAPGSLAYKTGGKAAGNLLSKVAPNASTLAQRAAIGAGAGATLGTAGEVVDFATGGERTISERLGNIAFDTALGGGADAGLHAIGKAIKPSVQSLIERFKKQPEPTSINQTPLDEVAATAQKEPTSINSSPSTEPPLIKLDDRLNPEVMGPLPENVNPRDLLRQQINFDGKPQKEKFSFDKAYTAVIDDLHPLEKATKELGGKVEAAENPYILARLSKGSVGRAETLLKGGIFDETGNKIGKSLQEIIQPFENNINDLIEYSVAKRALDYADKSLVAGIKPKGVGGTDQQVAESVIQQLDSPQMQVAHQELVQFNSHLLDLLSDAGILAKDAVERMKVENPNYIPFLRVQDQKTAGFQPLKKNLVDVANPIKKRTGSEKQIINPMESVIKNVYQMTNIADRNKVGRSLYNLAKEAGDNNWVQIIGNDKPVSPEELASVLNKADTEAIGGQSKEIDSLFDAGKGDEVYVYENGQKVRMKIQPDLYRSLKTLDAPKQHFLINALAVPARTLRAGAVLSPEFGAMNVFRDQFSSFLNSKYGFIPFVDMARGMSSVLKKDATYWQWKDAGGSNGILSGVDREYLQSDLRTMIKQSLGEKATHAMKNPLKTILEPLRKLSEISEESTRLGEFKKGLKKGASPQEAAFASRDLMDFSRAGYGTREYNKITAFFNAAVQGTDKLARTFKSDPKGASLRAVTLITMPSLAFYAMNYDQEWYQNLPQRDKDLFWHFKAPGTDQIVKIPKPFEAGVLFGTVSEKMLDMARGADPNAFEDIMVAIKNTFTPNLIPTAIAPLIEVYANKSLFNGAPVVPKREENLLPEDQYGPYNSEIAKLTSKLANTSPRNVDQVIRGYTGGLGKYASSGLDGLFQMLGAEKRIELPDRGLADVPIISRFLVKNLEGTNQNVEDFYNKFDQLKREKASADKNNQSFANLRLYGLFNKTNGSISDLQGKKRMILESPTLDGQQKTGEIKKIDELIGRLSKITLQQGGM